MLEQRGKLLIYSDYVCPFCYLGKRSLERYLATWEPAIEVDWHPYDLRASRRGPDGEIDPSIEDGKDEAYYDQVRRNVARLRDEYDAHEMLGIDEVPDVDSLPAQLASYHVKEAHPDRWPAFDDAIFEALWVNGRDIADIEVLAELAEDVGVPGDEVERAVADEALEREVREAFKEARLRHVTGVPTFLFDEYAARGAVPPDQLRRLVEGY